MIGTRNALLPEMPGDLLARRHAAVTRFLADRDLEPGWLATVMRTQAGDGELLLTSSPVHGLANHTSDLDFIRIQSDPIDGPRIATKIFERGHHLEVVSFSTTELRRNLDELDALAALPPAEIVAGFRAWDSRFEPRRKQTERIVNGLTLDGRAPYLSSLPSLALVWSRAALHTAVEQVTHLCLAEAAGESRGRIGYAYNVLLHLMDSILSLHGDVYTTRKWYLLRWTRFVRSGQPHEAYRELVSSVEQLRRSLSAAASCAQRIAEPYVDLVTRAVRVTTATAGVRVCTTIAEDAEYHGYLPGSGLLSAGGRAVVVPGRPDWDGTPSSLPELARIDATTAAARLRVVRAGVGKTTVDYLNGSTG